jgi:hypothetical protein
MHVCLCLNNLCITYSLSLSHTHTHTHTHTHRGTPRVDADASPPAAKKPKKIDTRLFKEGGVTVAKPFSFSTRTRASVRKTAAPARTKVRVCV